MITPIFTTRIIVSLLCIIGATHIKHVHAAAEEKYLRSRLLAANLCPDDCNTENCGVAKCERCEFTCGGTCYHSEKWVENAPSKPSDPPSTVCSIATFEDITSQKFADAYWYKHGQVGRPTQPETAPVFVDLNGDGVLDFHTVSHQRALAESVKVVCNGTSTGNCYKLQDVKTRIQMTHKQADSHGSTIMDLDGDGVSDLLISIGGGLGGVKGIDPLLTENTLLWGDLDANGDIIFKGGREAAQTAGIEMRSARGRFNFILDANGDGLLDIFFATDRPKVDMLTPGYLFINQGDRTFRKDDMVSEYSTSMLMTDVDGDGFANEFVITRDLCYPQTKGPYSDENVDYCKTRPLGTTAVYKFNPDTNQMEDIGKHYNSTSLPTNENQPPCCAPGTIDTFNPDNKNCYVRSAASADLDGDLLADQVFLYSTKLIFYFSSDRPVGTLPFGGQYVGAEIYLPLHCTGKVLRIVDLDNDGKEEIIVGCYKSARFLVYTQGATKSDWTLENGCNNGHALGDINDLALAAPNQDDYETACESNSRFAQELCNNYNKRGENQPIETITNIYLAGISVVDLDNGGFLDLVVSNYRGHILFFRNKPPPEKKDNRFIAIKLTGKGVGTGNVYGIGATVILYSKDCEGCEEQMREISSYQHATDKWGYQDERIYFGLGKNGKPTKAVVRWPNGSIQTKELCSWDFSSFVIPVTIEQCDKDADQCGDSTIPCEEGSDQDGDSTPQPNDSGESCEDSSTKFQFPPSPLLGCQYVKKFPDKRAFRCSRITMSGKPVSDFCRKSCGACK